MSILSELNALFETTNIPVETKIEKMSKSRYNVVNPDEVIEKYGADSMRMYEMFMGPLERDKPWTDEGIQGVYRFLRRIWTLFIDDNGNPWSPAWYTLNYKVMYAISDHVTISSGLENITDQRYRPYSSGIVAPGRNFILSVRASF